MEEDGLVQVVTPPHYLTSYSKSAAASRGRAGECLLDSLKQTNEQTKNSLAVRLSAKE